MPDTSGLFVPQPPEVGLSMEGREPRIHPDRRVGATDVSGSRGRVNVSTCVSACTTAEPSAVPFYARLSR